MRKQWLKKTLLTGLTVAMVLGGSSAAFAAPKGKGNDKDRNDLLNHGKPNASVNYNFNFNFNFNDIQGADVEWALKYIASLASKRVFDGYEDGTFRPRAPITRIEAIKAAVSTMGLGDVAQSPEEMNTKLNFKDANKIPSWAVGYVAVALEHDLFAETDDTVQPDKPADRLWFTTLLVKALGKEDEAKALMNTKLNFKDANQIPAGSVGYVAVAVQQGLISGYEDNTFRPNKPVTRAEAAKLLDLTGEQIDNNVIQGTVTSTVYNNSITITKNGQSRTYLLNPNFSVPVYRNGSIVTVAQLQIGDEVKLQTYTVNNVTYVSFIEVTKLADQNNAQFTVNGTLNYFGSNGQGKNIINITTQQNGVPVAVQYEVANNFSLITNGLEFKPGCTVELSIQNMQVNKIEIKVSAPSAS